MVEQVGPKKWHDDGKLVQAFGGDISQDLSFKLKAFFARPKPFVTPSSAFCFESIDHPTVLRALTGAFVRTACPLVMPGCAVRRLGLG